MPITPGIFLCGTHWHGIPADSSYGRVSVTGTNMTAIPLIAQVSCPEPIGHGI